jgi:hypothetical protein
MEVTNGLLVILIFMVVMTNGPSLKETNDLLREIRDLLKERQ